MKNFIIIFILFTTYIFAQENSIYENIFWLDLQKILQNHPKVRAQVLNLASKMKEYGYKKTVYPDPRFGIMWSNAPYNKRFKFNFEKEPMSGIEYSISQPIPFPGKLSLEAKITEKEVELERQNLLSTYNEISKNFLGTLVFYLTWKKIYKLTNDYNNRFKIASQSGITKYQTGKGTLTDLSNAILTEKKFKDELISIEGILKTTEENLNYYYSTIETNNLSNPEYENHLLKYIDILFQEVEKKDIELIISNTPYLISSKIISSIEEKKIHLQKYEYYPDFEVFLSYMKREKIQNEEDSGEDLMSAGISFRIPLWSAISNQKAISSLDYNEKKSRENVNEVILNMKTKLKELQIEIKTLRSRIDQYKNVLIPQSELSQQSALNSYTTGKIDFNDFSMTWMKVYELKQMLYSLEKELYLKKIEYLELSNFILPEITSLQSKVNQKEVLYEN